MLNYQRVTYNELGHHLQVICNNLGGFGPEKNAPQQLHYRAVAHLHGHAVDVVRPRIPGKGRRRWRWRTKMVISPRKKDETWIKTMVFDMMNI
jgi:hypothetical protein